MKKYSSLVFRELRISKKHYSYRLLMLLAFVLLFALSLFVLGNDKTRNGASLEGFTLIATYLIGIVTAVIIAEDNGVFKSDINSGWLIYSWALPLTAFEKAMTKYIIRVILIITGFAVTIASSLFMSVITDCTISIKGLLTVILIYDFSLIFYIIIEAFMTRATDKKALKKMSYVVSGVILALLFLPEFIKFDSLEVNEESLEQAMQSVEKTDELLSTLVLPDVVLYTGIPLMAVILVIGFIITMRNFRRREL